MKPIARLLCLSFCLFSYRLPLFGQSNLGTPSWSIYDGGEYDTLNLQNLNVSLNIPVMSKAGAIPFNFALSNGSVSGVYGVVSTGQMYTTMTNSRLLGIANHLLGPPPSYYTVTYSYVGSRTVTCPSGYGSGSATQYYGWFIVFSDGTLHWLPSTDYTYSGTTCSGYFTDQVIDGTGYTLSFTAPLAANIYTRGGLIVAGSTSITDPQSSPNSIAFNLSTGVFTDTLGLTALTQASGGNSWSWSDVNGGSPTASVTTTPYTLKSVFGCSGFIDYNYSSVPLPTTVSFPDTSSLLLAWESPPGYASDRTGRLSQITLRDGLSKVGYNYNPNSSSNDGLNCTYQIPKSMTRTTSDGTVTYTWAAVNNGSGNWGNTTTKVDIGGNKTVYTFTGLIATGYSLTPGVAQALTELQYFHNTGTVSNPTYSSTADRTDIYCYNSSTPTVGNCATAVVAEPVTEVDVFTAFAGQGTSYSRRQTQYDSYGNVTYSAQFDFGGSSPLIAITTSYGSWGGSACGPVGGNVNDKPCQIIAANGTNTISVSRFAYDSHGNLLTTYVSPDGGSTFLSNTTANSYNGNGTLSASYDLANNQTSYAYNGTAYASCGSCTQYPFPTTITNVGTGLSKSFTYNGIGGVKLTEVGPNGSTQKTTYAYDENCGTAADPWWRVGSTTDPNGNQICYGYSATSIASSFSFGSSVNNTTTTLDGYGRTILEQKQQGPGSGNYDTVSKSYVFAPSSNPSWHGVYSSLPCTMPKGSGCTNNVQRFYDMLGRPVETYNSGSTGYIAYTYAGGTSGVTREDVLQVLGPAPSGENVKQVQSEYDGLGRLTSSCALSTSVSGYTSCGQVTGSYSGVLTTTSYASATGSQTVSFTRGSQTRSQTLDGLGRVTSSTTPEGGTITNVYDSLPVACNGRALAYSGKLIYSGFANGNFSCYLYDSIGRIAAITGVSGSNTLCRRFFYDNSSGVLGAIPSGITLANQYGRMVEAETDTCAWPVTSSTMITDEWFSYDKNGNATDMWELTPHSTQYYHSTATFAGNGVITSLQLVSPSLYTINYTLDGEGRWNTLAKGSSNMVTGPTQMYNAAGQPTEVDLTGSDKDTYTYDPNTGNMTKYVFQVGSTNETGVPNWSPNQTLQQLAITDGFNSGGSQTCASSYDDLVRLTVFDCGSGNWGQDFGYDQYDNLTQTVISGRSGGTWNPGYNSSNNRVTGATYDASGDMTNDGGMNVYGYDQFNKLAWTAGSGTPTCGTSGKCITYDAFGRMVEKSSGSTWTEIWYTQVPGSMVNMSGTVANYGYWPSPGRGTFLATGNNLFMHQDWLGNDRIVSNIGGHTVAADRAYAPYGEQYSTFGGTNPIYGMFAGLTGDFDTGVLFDTPNRELAQYQGRWLSPDPAGVGWNQYAYPVNPNSNVDPSGLADSGNSGCEGNTICQEFDPASDYGFGFNVSDDNSVSSNPGNDTATKNVTLEVITPTFILGPNVMPFALAAYDYYRTVGETNSSLAWDIDSNFHVVPGIRLPNGDVAASSMAQQVFQGNRRLWNNANGTMKAVTALYAAGFTVVGGGAVVGGLPTMEIAVGAGEPFHVAYGVGGTWLNAVGNTLGNMTVSSFMASETAATAWFTVSVPILNEGAVLATQGCPAFSCATAALSALGQGWIP